MRPKAYIIGSGPSLLDLTKEEIQHLNHSQYTLSLNCYLEHWEKIGLLPKCHMMADGQFPTIKMLVNDTRLIQKLGDRITYYISHRYLSYFPNWMDISGVKHAFRKRWEIWAQFSYWVPWTISKKTSSHFHKFANPIIVIKLMNRVGFGQKTSPNHFILTEGHYRRPST